MEAIRPGEPVALVVDDEPQMRYIITFALETQSFTCLSAGSAEEAWDLLRSRQVDLVVLDVMLPGLGGAWHCASASVPPQTYRSSCSRPWGTRRTASLAWRLGPTTT